MAAVETWHCRQERVINGLVTLMWTRGVGLRQRFTSASTHVQLEWFHVLSFFLSSLPKTIIIGSAEALPILCVRYFRWEREREREREREMQTDRERERRKWRHHCRAKIGDEFTLSLAKNSHSWRWAYTFPCQKFALFVSPFTLPVSPFTAVSRISFTTMAAVTSRPTKTGVAKQLPAGRRVSPHTKWMEAGPAAIVVNEMASHA